MTHDELCHIIMAKIDATTPAPRGQSGAVRVAISVMGELLEYAKGLLTDDQLIQFVAYEDRFHVDSMKKAGDHGGSPADLPGGICNTD